MKTKDKEHLELKIKQSKIKITKQRKAILESFFSKNAHKSAEEILTDVRKVDENISLATVYRTLNLLHKEGLAHVHHFQKNQAKFEPNIQDDDHHDHLICTKCSSIIEFVNEKIEEEQIKIAAKYSFLITHHKMELYGLCKKCQIAP